MREEKCADGPDREPGKENEPEREHQDGIPVAGLERIRRRLGDTLRSMLSAGAERGRTVALETPSAVMTSAVDTPACRASSVTRRPRTRPLRSGSGGASAWRRGASLRLLLVLVAVAVAEWAAASPPSRCSRSRSVFRERPRIRHRGGVSRRWCSTVARRSTSRPSGGSSRCAGCGATRSCRRRGTTR